MHNLLLTIGLPDAKVAHYRHWDMDVDADVAYEAECLRDRAVQLVVAKSLGTQIAAHAFKHSGFRPRAAVLIGTVIVDADGAMLELFRHLADRIPVLFIQQSADPGGSYADLSRLVAESARAEASEVPGDDHAYEDLSALAAIIRPWLSAQRAGASKPR
jgi:hypothetical protein